MCFLVSRTCRFAAIGCFAIFYDSVFHTMLATISRQRTERFQKAKRRTTNQINNDTFLSVTRNDPSPPSCGLYVEIRRFYGTVLETQPDDNCSDGTCSSDGIDEYPAFSPEGLISWMFERCNRRFEEAMMIGDVQKANAYNQRRALLVDFLVQQGISMNQRIPSIGEFKKAMWPWLLFKL